MQTATDDRLVGRLLEGRYRLRAQLARGGMSTVYVAVDERLEREVAVKVMSPTLSTDPAFADRFAQEARVAARLSHANVVSVFDQGADSGHVFLVMELVRGRTLRDLIRQHGALAPALALSIMQPVLAALATAHRAGLMHRDVKPENILLADDGAVKVADFGLARAVESDLSSTRTGLMMGTVAYCPPEQLSRGASDARSDVYSAGIVLFELLTGSAPYTGDNPMAVAYQHVNSVVPAPSSRRGGIAWQLDDIVRRATSRDPVARQLDAGAFLAELHDVRVDLGMPVVAIPPRTSRPGQDATTRLPRQNVRATNVPQRTAPTEAVRSQERTHNTLVAEAGPFTRDPARPASPARPVAAPPKRRRKRRRRAILVTLLILLLGAAAGAGTWWYASGRYDKVPDVSGRSQSAAAAALKQQGFKVSLNSGAEFSESVPVGSVISTAPGSSARLVRGRTIEMVLSKGAERFGVPPVAGTFAQAMGSLAVIPEVQVVESDTSSDTIKAGQVIRTDPVAGKQVPRGQVITVYVSTGLPVLGVPNVVGSTQAAATTTLSANFKPVIAQDFSETVPLGTVISQNPLPNQQAVKHSPVTVVISKGKQMVTIPQIAAGSDASVANALLQSLGLDSSIKKRHRSIFDFSGYTDQVVSVDPPSGETVPVGTTVVITAQ